MPWTLNDYPSSMKNMNHATKKKAIDIANAMIDEGYDEGRAIPISIKQAKEWRENSSQDEIRQYEKSGKPTKRSEKDKKYENNPERLDEEEYVIAQDTGWAVKSSGAKKASHVFDEKDKAIARAKDIAQNKGTYLTIFNRDGSIQKKQSFIKKS